MINILFVSIQKYSVVLKPYAVESRKYSPPKSCQHSRGLFRCAPLSISPRRGVRASG